MRGQRQVVDYSLRRRALLREVYAGMVSPYEVCDASPYLKNAAKYHGERTEVRCPICRRENLALVHYIFGDDLRDSAGQARPVRELAALAATVREFQVYVVEVCRGCDWNHLVEQYRLGRGVATGQRAGPAAGAAAAAAGGAPSGRTTAAGGRRARA